MTHFVADNLEHKIKAASPKEGNEFYIIQTFWFDKSKISVVERLIAVRHASLRSNMLLTESATEQIQRQFFSAFPQIDANALNDIEIEAQYLAANLDGITENLCNLLHSVNV